MAIDRKEAMSTIGRGLLLAIGVIIGIVLIVWLLRSLGVTMPAFLS